LVHVGSLLQKRTQHPTDGWSAGTMLKMNLIESQTCLPFFFAPRALNLLRRDEFIATAGKLEVKIRLECSSYFLYS
jgi:hypothetical protein